MLAAGGLGDGGDVEGNGVATADVHDGAVDEGDAEALEPAAGGAVFEAAGAGGVGGDGATEEGHGFGGIGRVELTGGFGGGVEIVECDAGADGGVAFVDIEAAELLHGDEPAAVGDAAGGEAAAAAGDGDGRVFRGGVLQDLQQFRFVGGDADLIGVAFCATGIFEVAPAHSHSLYVEAGASRMAISVWRNWAAGTPSTTR